MVQKIQATTVTVKPVQLTPNNPLVTYDNGDGVERRVDLTDFDACEYFADTRVMELRVIGNAYRTERIMLRQYRQPEIIAGNIRELWRVQRLAAGLNGADA